jgi:hypothetical protein
VRGSDLTVRHGHISKQGSTWPLMGALDLREAAQTAKRSPQFAATYQAIARRRGKKIATTAVARKLLTRAYHLLTETADKTCTPSRHRAGPKTGRITLGELAKTHEPAPAALDDRTEQPGPRMPRLCIHSAAPPRRAAEWVYARPLRQPHPPGEPPQPHRTLCQASSPARIRRRSSASSSFVLGSAANRSAPSAPA